MRFQSMILAAAFAMAVINVAGAGNSAPSTSNPSQQSENRHSRPRPVDCHRDVRTHRIGGVKVTHRHVGDNCQVRQVRQVN
jgi:hypothetical protein